MRTSTLFAAVMFCFFFAWDTSRSEDHPTKEQVDDLRKAVEALGGKLTENIDANTNRTTWTIAMIRRADDDKLAAMPVPSFSVGMNLYGANVTDAGMKHLSKQKALSHLFVGHTKVTDTGLRELVGLKELRILYLSGTAVTDDGLKSIAKITSLKELFLTGTKVTDSGLKHLAGLPELTHLSLRDTLVTDEGIRELKERLPKCKVFR